MPRIGSQHHVLGVERSAKRSTVKRRKSSKIVRHGPPHHSARSVRANCPVKPTIITQNCIIKILASEETSGQPRKPPAVRGQPVTPRQDIHCRLTRPTPRFLLVLPMNNSSVSPVSSVKLSRQSRSQRTNGPSWRLPHTEYCKERTWWTFPCC